MSEPTSLQEIERWIEIRENQLQLSCPDSKVAIAVLKIAVKTLAAARIEYQREDVVCGDFDERIAAILKGETGGKPG